MAAELIHQQATGDGSQQGAGLAGRLQIGPGEQTHEGVLADVFGALRALHRLA
ncbi:hypothetical protein D3C80_1925310 [compost metagenome]